VRTVYPIGTTLYRPEARCNGYTLVWSWQTNIVKLIDMNRRPTQQWRLDGDEQGSH